MGGRRRSLSGCGTRQQPITLGQGLSLIWLRLRGRNDYSCTILQSLHSKVAVSISPVIANSLTVPARRVHGTQLDAQLL